MLQLNHISIQNFKLIRQADINLQPGLNVVTGTTGAGKSMFIQSLKLLLGAKASSRFFDRDKTKIRLSAEFGGTDSAISALLQDQGIDAEDDRLIIRRDIAPGGQNRCFVNDVSVTVTWLQRLGERLMDFHGQHDEQSILKQDIQLEVLDRMANNDKLLGEYTSVLNDYETAKSELESLRASVHEREDRLQLLRFKAKEIDALNPQAGEIDQLKQTIDKLKNRSQITDATDTLRALVSENDTNLQGLMQRTSDTLDDLVEMDNSYRDAQTQAQIALDAINEISYALSGNNGSSDDDSDDLDGLQERLFALRGLEKKLARSLDEIIAYREEIHNDLNQIENLDAVLAQKEATRDKAETNLIKLATKLHQARAKAAKGMAKAVNQELQDLALKGAAFRVSLMHQRQNNERVDQLQGISRGFDKISYEAALNKGEDFQPIKATASGGETARIMLAIKKVIAHHDSIGFLVFDEIDSDTGGRLGNVIGQKMHDIAQGHQILCITHLPQTAAFGNHHLKVEKDGDGEGTTTRVVELDEEGTVKELAHMMEGEELTDLAITHAKRMRDEAQAQLATASTS